MEVHPQSAAVSGTGPGRRKEPSVASRPLERSQVVWRLALELGDPPADTDRFAVARRLVRAAGNDPTTLAHALALGDSRLRHPSADGAVQRGVDVLAWTVEFLGDRPPLHSVVAE